MTLRVGALCAGYGGLDLAVQQVLGGELAWVAEKDPAAAKVLALRFPGVPNLGDIERVGLEIPDAEWADIKAAQAWELEQVEEGQLDPSDVTPLPATDWSGVPRVDIVTAGWPCQDMSLAGLRRGLVEGTRSGLWFHIAKALDVLRPPLVILENVRGLLSARADSDVEPCPWCLGDPDNEPPLRALGAVLADLAELGFDAEWVGLRAADVGACHGRFRVGVLAWPAADPDRDAVRLEPVTLTGSSGPTVAGLAGVRPAAADSTGPRCCGGEDAGAGGSDARPGLRGVEPERGSGEPAADPDLPGRERGDATERPDPGGRPGTHDGRSVPGRRGDAPADPDGIGRECAWGAEARGGLGPADHGGPVATDAHGCGLGADQRQLRQGQPDADRRAAADPEGDGRDEGWPEPAGIVGGSDAAERRGATPWGPYAAAIHRWELTTGRPAPAPTEPAQKGGQRLSARFVEWMLGLPAGWVTDVPGLTRNDQLRILGNGVVPQQFALAIRVLLDRAFGVAA